MPNQSSCNAGVTRMQIVCYDWRCARKKWDAEGNNSRLLSSVSSMIFYSWIFAARSIMHFVTLNLPNFLCFYGLCLFNFYGYLIIIINIRDRNKRVTFLVNLLVSDTRAFGRSEFSLELPTWQANHASFGWLDNHLQKIRRKWCELLMDLSLNIHLPGIYRAYYP